MRAGVHRPEFVHEELIASKSDPSLPEHDFSWARRFDEDDDHEKNGSEKSDQYRRPDDVEQTFDCRSNRATRTKIVVVGTPCIAVEKDDALRPPARRRA